MERSMIFFFFPQDWDRRTRTCVFWKALISYYLVYSFLYRYFTYLSTSMAPDCRGFFSFAVFFSLCFPSMSSNSCIQISWGNSAEHITCIHTCIIHIYILVPCIYIYIHIQHTRYEKNISNDLYRPTHSLPTRLYVCKYVCVHMHIARFALLGGQKTYMHHHHHHHRTQKK